jgi:hypothetical protein
MRCARLPETFHGQEGVDASSPSEGFGREEIRGNQRLLLSIERDGRGDCRRLDLSSSRRSIRSWPRLVCLEGGAAGAEFLRFSTRVFEFGAGVGVDELAGLDPLESVML